MAIFHRFGLVLCMVSLGVALLAAPSAVSPALGASGAAPSLPSGQGKHSAPLLFVENVGQFGQGARFQVQANGATLYLAGDGIWLSVLDHSSDSVNSKGDPSPEASSIFSKSKRQAPPRKGVNVKLSFVGANPHPRIEPFDRLPTHISYFRGNDPAKWHSDVPVYAGVRYIDLYPGVDLEITSANGSWSWSMVSTGGSLTTAPRLRVDGADRVGIDNGGMTLTTAVGNVAVPLLASSFPVSAAPSVSGNLVTSPFLATTPVSVNRNLAPSQSAPALLYSTLFGGLNGELGYGIALDANRDAYVTGYTYSSDFPSTPGDFQASCAGNCVNDDAFVAKLNSTGTELLYATFLGGSANERGNGIAVDDHGNAYVTGYTYSADFPTTQGAFQTTCHGCVNANTDDVFVTELSPNGTTLAYSTFLGGSGSDSASAIAVDEGTNAYITGSTQSTDFPTTVGAFNTGGNSADAFVTKLNPSGTALAYSALLGGSDYDLGASIALNQSGNAYVTGYTRSTDFPTTPGAFQTTLAVTLDAFVAELEPDGSDLVYSTYLGGSGGDYGVAVAVDSGGNTYVTGITDSDDFPTTPNAFQVTRGLALDTFITKVKPGGAGVIYSTLLGGNNDDTANDLAIDGSGNAYVTGRTLSTDFPTTSNAFQSTYGDNPPVYNHYNGFVTELNSDGIALLYSTYLAAYGQNEGDSIAVDTSGYAYVTGGTTAQDFPTTPGAYQSSNAGYFDAFVTKLSMGRSIFQTYLPFVSR